MFPLAGKEIPTTAAQLTGALEKGLAGMVTPLAGRKMVTLEAENYPTADQLAVDISGGQVVEAGLKPPQSLKTVGSSLFVNELKLSALPLVVRTANVRVNLNASKVTFEFAQDETGRLFLVPSVGKAGQGGGEGQVRAEISTEDIQEVLLSVLKPVAAQNGVSVEDLKVTLASDGPRTVRVQVAATGKKLFMKAKIRVLGKVDVADDLVAKISDLKVEGDGFIGEMAEKMIQPQLNAYNQMTFPLAGFSLGGLKIKDLAINTDKGIAITASLTS